MDYLYALDIVGTMVFAMSGALAADEHDLDFFGASVIGFITAVGGGTVRDILIGSTPVGWMLDETYLYCIGAGIFFAWFFKPYIIRLRKTLFLFDTIGIGIFTVLGTAKTLTFGLSPLVAIMMGMVSSVFGGVLRDTLTNEIPLIFRKEIYATACLSGATAFVLFTFLQVNEVWATWLSVSITITLRVMAVSWGWSLGRRKRV